VAYALQQLINGVTLGMIYGLIAVGYTMVYGIIGMINFAHGDIFMVGALLSLIALTGLAGLGITSVPLALALTLVFAAGIAALYGWTVERVAYRPLRGSFRLAPLMVRQIFSAIRALNRETGLTVLLVEQNTYQALRLAHRGYVLVNGAITMAGSGAELLARPEIRAAYLEGGH